MEAMKTFTLWLINNVPTFLMSEPVIYFVALAILAILVRMICRLFFVERIK